MDPNFRKYYLKIKEKKVPFGFYHFFRFNKSGKIQANNFLNSIKNIKTKLPLVIDVEEWGNTTSISKEEVVKEITVFIKYVELKTKRRIMIYSNESTYNKYIKDNFNENKIWICSFSSQPNINKSWTFWQHSHKGKYSGAAGWIDVNTFNGKREDWIKFIKI